MTYQVIIFDSDGATPEQKAAAARRFREVLEAQLGDSDLVVPVYLAFRRIAAAYGESPDLLALSEAEREIWEQWSSAEGEAVAAAFGTHRYMGDAMYRIKVE